MTESFTEYDTPEHYETVLKHIHDGVYTLDPNGQITWVNETAVEEFDIGFEREDLIGASVSIVLEEDDIQKCVAIIQECLQDSERQSGRCEITLQTADGREIPCDLHLALLPLKEGEFQGSVGVIRDISARKRREQQLEVQNRVLRHNLRNEMNIILGRAERISGAVAEELRPDVENIREVGVRLLELSEKVRSISMIQESSADNQVTITLNDRINAIIDAFRTEYPDVTFEYQDATEEAVEKAVSDEEVFDLTVENLIENSVIHNDSTEPLVSITLERKEGLCCVRVADNGPGLPETERQVLESGTETDLQHSSGVGLWLVRWCVDELGGDIRFPVNNPTDTIVTVEIPI